MRDDRVYLEHIRDAVDDIAAYCRTDHDSFVADRMRQDATSRKSQVIGQAVKNLSEYTKSRQPQDRLERAPVIDPSTVLLPPVEAAERGTARCVTALVLAWRAVGRTLRRAARRVVPAAAAIAAFVGPGTAAATAQTTLADVRSMQCTFTRQATGRWTKGGAPETVVRPSSLVLRFEAIDTETGTAQLRNGAMTTDVIVRLTEGYLHLMQAFRTGPLYTTTVFEAGASAGVFRAAHSRHELFATPLPGATSSPEQYYGTCEARQ